MKKTVILCLIIGFLFGLCVMLFMGANTGNPVGKYQVAITYADRPRIVTTILDTQTGIAKQWDMPFVVAEAIFIYDYTKERLIEHRSLHIKHPR